MLSGQVELRWSVEGGLLRVRRFLLEYNGELALAAHKKNSRASKKCKGLIVSFVDGEFNQKFLHLLHHSINYICISCRLEVLNLGHRQFHKHKAFLNCVSLHR